MPININGHQLGVHVNGTFSGEPMVQIPGGRLWDEAGHSWNAMHAFILKKTGVSIRPLGPKSSARSLEDQQGFYNAHQRDPRNNPPAAYPGTSNHGWGIAVDVNSEAAANAILKYGHLFGWSHDEGARVGEWWHMRYVGGYVPKPDPFRVLAADEKRWVKEYKKLKDTHRDLARRRELRSAIEKRRKSLWHAAQKSGWGKLRRKARYAILRRYSS